MRALRVAGTGLVGVLCMCALATGSASAQAGEFQRVALVDDSTAPMEVDVAGDGRVFYIERFGQLRVWDPGTESTSTIGSLQVYGGEENGVLGLALAPDFDQSDQLYLHYSVPPEATLTQRVSRFTLDAGGQLDIASEEVIYEYTHQRQTCCHSAGSLEFDPDGSLYISTGDNVNPFESQGFTPIDERPGREAWDAQGTSANTNDPNGKLLRITPNETILPGTSPGIGETYEIPDGNMFGEDGDPLTLPEIHSMGFRNPFRFTIDPETGWVLLADYGPDAGQANPARGPQGSVEFNVFDEPINSGWPYCIRENVPYIDGTFGDPNNTFTSSGVPFDCENPTNDSPNNTGLTELPANFPATMWQGFTETDPRYPGLGTNGAPTSGPRYSFDPDNPSETKFPADFDGRWFIASWNNSWIRTVDLDAEGTPSDVQNFPDLGFLRPIDMTFGPDGSLYLAEWGSGGGGGGNANSGVYRIEHVIPTGPQVTASAEPEEGVAPLEVEFDGEATDPDGNPNPSFTYEWDFGDGSPASVEEDPVHTYTEPGTYTATLTVTDPVTEEEGSDTVEIRVSPECGPEPPDADDDFEGSSLDECRWTQIVRPVPGQLSVGDGTLSLDTGNNTDMFGGNTTAENIVLQPAPDGTWEIETRVTLPFTGKDFEQAGLMLYGTDADWAKLMFIKVPGGGAREVEFTLQDGGNPIFDANLDRSGVLDASFPDTIHLRMRNDGTSLTAAYSEDGEDWTEFGRSRPQSAIPDPRFVGVGAFNGDGSGNEAAFDFFRIGEADEEPDPCTEPEQPDPGYEMLFDGTAESQDEWQMAGPGGFNLTAQCTLESFGGLGLLHREEAYESPVTFRMEWMMPGDDNSGVFVGNWPAGPNAHVASNNDNGGYEVQIDATDALDRTTGSIYAIQAPEEALRDEALNPPGEWNTYEITVDDPEIVVRLNGAMINRYVHDPASFPNHDISATRLGIQNHGGGDTVFFRRIQVKEHGAPPFEAPGCVDTGPVDPSDDFEGTELDGCRWNRVVRPDAAGRDVSGGALNIETSYADIFGAENSPVTNMVLQDAPEGDWTAETKVTAPLAQCCQQAGLIAYLDDGNYVKWDVIADPEQGQARLELRSEIDDEVQEPQHDEWVDYPDDDTYWLRLAKAGDTYSAAYSLDGESWTEFGEEVSNPAIADGSAIGVFALGILQDAPIWASFDSFSLDSGSEVGEPRLRAIGQPKLRKAGPRQKQVSYRMRARNVGDAPSGSVRLCAAAPAKRVRILGQRCVNRASIPAEGERARAVKVRIKPKARGKVTQIRLNATGPDVDRAQTTVRLRARR